MSSTSFLLKCQLSVTTTNHALVLGPRRDPDRAPRIPGPGGPTVGAQGHRCRWRQAEPGRAQDRDRYRRIEASIDCTIRAPRRSSAPSRPARCYQTLAYCSPPFHFFQTDLRFCRSPTPSGRRTTIWATGSLAPDVPPSHDHARRQALATPRWAATGQARQPATPGARAHPADRRSREPAGPARVVPGRSIPHRARSWARHLLVLFHQISARHSPPSTISHRLNLQTVQ
jgi:hypothetical protein